MSVAMFFKLDWKIGLGYIIGYSLGRYIDPDWDLIGTNMAEGRLVNEIPILGHFLYGVSSTYGSIFRKKHRSFITHYPVVSTFVRLAFVFWFPITLANTYGFNLMGGMWLTFWISLWMGLSHADAIHYYHDLRGTQF